LASSAAIRATELLSAFWGRLRKVTFDLTRRDGTTATLVREVYDFGDGAAVIPFDAGRGTVLLVRQFRLPAYLAGGSGFLVEACAGLLDGNDPETCARREAEEELGYRLKELTRVYTIHSSPGTLVERITLFTAPYSPADGSAAGGGEIDEGEDIEVLEMPLAEALAMVGRGEIVDAKTIILLQHLSLNQLSVRTMRPST
jgi:nudix-type nucleoside diphosphatase (YffH/AdpP family)